MGRRSMSITATKNSKALSTLEYVIFFIVLAAVAIAMATYFKRSVQGRYRQTGDLFGGGEQRDTAPTTVSGN